MATIRASAEQIIPAPADQVYGLLADYRVGHPSILPSAFSHYAVLEGGTGAGTRIRFRLRLGGRTQETEGLVTEPEPGRMLVETDNQIDPVTTFTVDPLGQQCRLLIESVWEASPGIRGVVERWLAPRLLRRLFREELSLIDHHFSDGSQETP